MLSNQELWRRFKEENDQKAREQLIMEYLDLVKYQAGRVNTYVPDRIELEDLESYGIIGLIDAIEKFDPSRGYKFNSYAQKRIKGEIIDQLRKLDWLPHSLRQKAKVIKSKTRELESKMNRSPKINEIAAELDFSKDQITKVLKKLEESQWVSIYSELNGKSLIDWLPSSKVNKPQKILDKKNAIKILKNAIVNLSDKQKLVVSLIYYEELTQKEVAEIMDLSPARISQIHKKAVYRLRGYLSRKKEEFQ
ncbi:MAG TPA: FliA/WhiG family RNA polymerase sigma factor [Halanaerobiales bacterium]|nr:FliA/WhiG family RNA polymerase sigma factor [Halanaerobiales bacterium]